MIPQFHSVDLYRPAIVQGTSQNLQDYSLVSSGLSCFVQQGTSNEGFFTEGRGLENTAAIYFGDTSTEFQRNDLILFGDIQYHVIGVNKSLTLNVYTELDCVAYPESHRKRLNMEDVE